MHICALVNKVDNIIFKLNIKKFGRVIILPKT